MNIIKGIKISPGIAIGPVYHFERDNFIIPQTKIEPNEVDSELLRLQTAITKSVNELTQIRELVLDHLDKEHARMIDAQIMALTDEEVLKMVRTMVKDGMKNVLWAYFDVMTLYERTLEQSLNNYHQERNIDLIDVKKRLIHHLLSDEKYSAPEITRPSIVITSRITPSDFLNMDKSNVLGLITETGGVDSHTAIISRALKIPYISNVENFELLVHQEELILDAIDEKAIVEYDDSTRQQYRELAKGKKSLLEYEVKRTKDGTKFEIFVNTSFDSEVDTIDLDTVKGIGLYRTEFLSIQKNAIPNEEDQFNVYRSVVQKVQGKPVTFRTFDFGRDKFVAMLDLEMFHNDQIFEDWGGIQFCLENPDLLKNQIKAILRAGQYGPIRIMLPMVSSLNEVKESMRILEKAKVELQKENKDHCETTNLGVMIETKNILFHLDELAEIVEFFSIGTNDLALYLFGSKRDQYNAKNHYHPMMFKAILKIVEVGDKKNIPVSVCGEMASDNYALIGLVAMGVRSISVNSGTIEPISVLVENIDLKSVTDLKYKLLNSTSAAENLELLKDYYIMNFNHRK